jgi:hypothetical protein
VFRARLKAEFDLISDTVAATGVSVAAVAALPTHSLAADPLAGLTRAERGRFITYVPSFKITCP